ncbi:carbohydrate ABC transporter permease [Halegenticoccus soli]|uniref:carbohydrate ABC transporter permease n=1 Tax=Halegenticoccus soli TaxID=1985678 RepID=UPI000C6ED9D8|nr:sugar ABC transporter permease [Halegenticoccus soli]
MGISEYFPVERWRRGRRSWDRRTLTGMALMVPALVIVAIALIYPFLGAIQISFLNIGTNEFVGLRHYRWLIGQDVFWAVVGRSVVWTVANLALQGAVGIGIALLLHRHFFGRDAVRTVMLIPFVIPSAVTAISWQWVLNASYGPVNEWLLTLGLLSTPVNPFSEAELAFPTVILINTWRWAPLVALVVFAVLQTIPREEYEAARIEGAGIFSEFYHVTYPHLKDSLLILGLIGFLLTFNIFDLIWLLTKGGPVGVTTTLPVFIYEVAFNLRNIGRASAVSVVLFLLLVVFVALYFRQREFKESEFA